MKMQQVQKLQNLQNAFSSLFGLTLIITDHKGKWITNLSGIMELVRLLLKAPKISLSVLIVLMMEKIHPIENPIVYETDTGFKLAVAPIRIKGQAIYYISAGIMVDESSKGLIAQSLVTDLPEEREIWESALQVTPSYDQERIKWILHQLEELANIIQTLLEHEGEKGKNAYRLQLLNLLSLMDRSDPHWLQGALKVFVQAMELEFAGVAVKSAGEQYYITETIGFEKEASLQGVAFYNGEGLLGQVSLTKQMGYWEKLEHDPRAAVFRTSGVNPQILICYPIKYKNQLYGLLFGGHSTKVELTEELADIGALLTNQLAADMYGIELEEKNDGRNIQIEVLLEMAQSILDIRDHTAYFQMLVKTIQRVFKSPFIGLFMKDSNEAESMLYASGTKSEEHFSEYRDDIAARYFGEGQVGYNRLRKPTQRNWNEWMLLEHPVIFNDEVIGVLGVMLDSDKSYKEIMFFLHALNTFIVIKLQEAFKEVDLIHFDSLNLLHQALRAWKPEAYKKAIKIKALSQEFLNQLNGSLEEIDLIGQASLLSEYEEDMLFSLIGKVPAVRLLSEARSHLSAINSTEIINKGIYGQVSKALSLILSYCEQGDRKGLPKLLFTVEEPLKRSFEHFLANRMGKVAFAQQTLDQMTRFTPREKEILNLLLKGLKNSEIATMLFISAHTVKNHVTKIYEKLGVVDRAQAIAKIYLMT